MPSTRAVTTHTPVRPRSGDVERHGADRAHAQSGTGAIESAPAGYAAALANLEQRIRQAQLKASTSVNRELIALYWDIGREIVERQERDGWGSAVIERLSVDLRRKFPGQSGFALRNLWYTRSFYLAYARCGTIVQQPVAQLAPPGGARNPNLPQAVAELDSAPHGTASPKLPQAVAVLTGPDLPEPLASIPWGHNRLLLDKLGDSALRLWYARQAVANGWSRSVLALQIQTELHTRLGPAAQTSNFDRVLPPPQSDLARAMLKDPYNFEFLDLAPDVHERELERGLVEHISQFLVELGIGFAYVGRQYAVTVGGEQFFLDLLFYHLALRCYVVIDLKIEPFKPEFAGKMGFYLAAVDAQLRHRADGPSIGLILCTGKNGIVVEYALRDLGAPVGVAEYRVTAGMPGKMPQSLPSTELLAAEMAAALSAGARSRAGS